MSEKSKKKKKKKNKKSKASATAAVAPPAHQGGRFAHATPFDHLQDTLDENSEEEVATSTSEEVLEFDALPSEDAHASDPVVADTDGVSDSRIGAAASWDTIPVLAKAEENVAWGEREVGTVMPSFDSDFWKVYGNKARVLGTQEGVAVLD